MRSTHPRRRARRRASEHGFASLTFPLLLWVLVVAGIALVDVAAYLVAAARAQQAADAAALAAVAGEIDGGRSPQAAAIAVTDAADARLETCECRVAGDRMSVAVSVAVPGLVVPRFGAARVSAVATAEAVETAPPVDAGPATWWPLDR